LVTLKVTAEARDWVLDEQNRLRRAGRGKIRSSGYLFAQGLERKALGKLRVRLERGAKSASERYYFDSQRGIVRRREREVGS
jgi:hypothetical protein